MSMTELQHHFNNVIHNLAHPPQPPSPTCHYSTHDTDPAVRAVEGRRAAISAKAKTPAEYITTISRRGERRRRGETL
ncbi:uncharacterized protein H6S33_007180 [Morchella sextelata]|uniref:uncharacterized protein n=1 Tax=Morchella sextelata TaxID=1174677 RepID=UPI001D0376D0|nr:uncharacterized protein H6S33_007180 [Morchella sextelata]KAH0604149.1 hypothetical protein H6S33_007180 [Morchella sextelata]